MMELSSDELTTINSNPLRNSLDEVRGLLQAIKQPHLISYDGAVDDPEQARQAAISKLLLALMGETAAFKLCPRPPTSSRDLASELSKLFTRFRDGDFTYDHYQQLLELVLQKAPDTKIWQAVFELIATITRSERTTPAPRPSPTDQTPRSHNTSSLANSSEFRKNIDYLLKGELLGELHPDIPGFYAAFFDDIEGLGLIAANVFNCCKVGECPLYSDDSGWRDWPDNPIETPVLDWLTRIMGQFVQFVEVDNLNITLTRRPLAQPARPIEGSIAKRKLDIGFVDDPDGTPDKQYNWSEILIPGELKNDRSFDTPLGVRLDLARYAREILAAQDSRRFVIGFTLCGPLLRVWEFDRCGGIGSEQIDINENGLQFVTVMLGFLLMNRFQLGFDPTIITQDNKRYVRIEKDGKSTRLVIDRVILRVRCVAGRATTCWKTYHEDDPKTPLVVKDSWQYPERDEEGELLCKAMKSGVINVARYYYHETVQVNGQNDDVQTIRKGLGIAAGRSEPDGVQATSRASNLGHTDQSSMRRKRSSDLLGPTFPPPRGKRNKSNSPSKHPAVSKPLNRVHRRVVIRDYGTPICRSSSRVALLAGMEGCISGYESLYFKTGLIQSDVSPRNLLVNEDPHNPSYRAFLIDLDLAIEAERNVPSGARAKTGTRPFMAIGVLYGEKHSFMHDLESFFWVLFWICIHYEDQDKERKVDDFEKWNYMNTEELANAKKGIISDESDFLRTAEDNFTSYYQPLVQWVNKLRRIVFPNGRRSKNENSELGSEIRRLLQEAQRDPSVID